MTDIMALWYELEEQLEEEMREMALLRHFSYKLHSPDLPSIAFQLILSNIFSCGRTEAVRYEADAENRDSHAVPSYKCPGDKRNAGNLRQRKNNQNHLQLFSNHQPLWPVALGHPSLFSVSFFSYCRIVPSISVHFLIVFLVILFLKNPHDYQRNPTEKICS